MAETKTKLTAESPKAFIDRLEDPQKRKDCHELAALMKEITGKPAKMWGPSIVGFDQYHYKYASGREGVICLTGFSRLYIKTLDDVDRNVLRELVATSVEELRKRHGVQ